MSLKSLKKKSKDVKIVPTDKGNAAIIMTNSQYLQKMEEHLNTSTYSLLKKNPTDSYYHFVNDGFGHFIDHAEEFLEHLNSMASDLEYTIEHPSPDGVIPFLDIIIHPDTSTFIYRKPTNTNLYTHYS